MIVVDSSVWIDFFRGRDRSVRDALVGLLDANRVALAVPVHLELLSGASRADHDRLRRVLSALPRWLPTDATWARIEGWVVQANRTGDRFGISDLLIAGIAAEQGAPVWSRDPDFARMERLGFVERHIC